MKQIKIIGEIGWDVYPGQIEQELRDASGDIEVIIDSPGGSVFDGVTIYNLLNNYDGKKHVVINGIAASMATYIAMVGDTIKAHDNSTFMIHNAWGAAIGDYRDMQKMADTLEGLTKLLAKKYAAKTGKSEKEVRSMMDDEIWLFGDEIKATGFVDEIVSTDTQDDRQAALALAREKFKSLAAKMKQKEEEDEEKIAALIKDISEDVKKIKQNKGNEIERAKMLAELEKAKLKLKMKER